MQLRTLQRTLDMTQLWYKILDTTQGQVKKRLYILDKRQSYYHFSLQFFRKAISTKVRPRIRLTIAYMADQLRTRFNFF